MVQRRHDARARDVEDRVHVEVVLRRLVFGEDRLVEHCARAEVVTREHDVATEVVPRPQAVERRDAADAVRLRVVDATLRIRVDLDVVLSTLSSAARTCSGSTDSKQRPPTGQIRGCQRDPRKSTRSLYAYSFSATMHATSQGRPTTARACTHGRK